MKRMIYLLLLALTLPITAQEEPLPAPVKEAFYAKYPKATDVEWNFDDQQYSIEFYQSGRLFTSLFTDKAKWVETAEVISDFDIPEAITQYIKKNYPDATIAYCEWVEVPDQKNSFRVNLEDESGSYSLISDAKGGNINVSPYW